ncbi:quinoprotein dehydrogenase-associated putative ABC transporter substrate-binding protein [Alsobacter soli]|uniref:Quinoprotein dehydrogenase-associated putative ABC transporter substrate-binding protein n=1 Tax=Alsobacter soli TaxID=2109933 RepID=A0A2T1HX37_9HYPH|nr:quinoprotein dehydrogenase-associated putative ABC transporter substrate-binding protein [Alsobacter soli]PSC06160.1 quinoprotein dehydrogenase-associated putative ABC transporter substrate-binding protein [Alsobacter soli]
MRSGALLALFLAGSLGATSPGLAEDAPAPLRVCADPNNAPFSKQDGSGFENAIARLVAEELRRPLDYVWWAQRRGFIRNTLKAGICDVVIGAPAHHYDMALRTRPYYRSTYVAVTRADRHLDITDLHDPSLKSLTIGVHLIGDDGANPPPAHALAQLGVVNNVKGYPIYGDYRQDSPPQRLIEAVAKGEVDVAFAWGPMAGPVAKASPVPLRIQNLEGEEAFAPLEFTFEIAMAVSRDNLPLRRELQRVLDRRGGDIRALLEQAGVPLLPFRRPSLEIVAQPGGADAKQAE